MKDRYANKSDIWATRPEYFKWWGPTFDPCQMLGYESRVSSRGWQFETDGDSFSRDWPTDERIFINPPFTRKWGAIERSAECARRGGNVILILLAQAGDSWHRFAVALSDYSGTPGKRVSYMLPNGTTAKSHNPGVTSSLFAFGAQAADALRDYFRDCGGTSYGDTWLTDKDLNKSPKDFKSGRDPEAANLEYQSYLKLRNHV